MSGKDVHTEHCCKVHGCKYGSDICTVEHGDKIQSYPCEMCDLEVNSNQEKNHLKTLITANNAYFQSSRKCGINSGPTVSAYNEMKTATEAASRFIEGG